MGSTNEANWISIAVGAVCLVLAIAAGIRLGRIVSGLSSWQSVAYALVAGIFIAIIAVMADRILKSFFED